MLLDQDRLLGYTMKFEIDCRLRYERRADDSDYLVQIVGHVQHEDDESPLTTVGQIVATRIECGRMINDHYGEGYDDCDAVSAELEQVGAMIFNQGEGDLFTPLYESFKEVGGNGFDVLILDQLKVEASHRGHGVGLAAMWRTIQTFGGDCVMVLCKPFPLDRDRDAPRTETKKAVAKLRAYYRRLGFKPIPGTEYMGFNPAMRAPKLWRDDGRQSA